MSAVTVWTKKPCPQCVAVKRMLTKAGVEFEEIDLMQNPMSLEHFKEQGLSSAPIVEAHDLETFAGFQPDAVNAVIAKYGTK